MAKTLATSGREPRRTADRLDADRVLLTRDDVLTAAEAAELLGIPRSTLYDYARRGLLPARQIGRTWIFRRSALDVATQPSDAGDDRSTRQAPKR